ncbi:MAG: J domain-containing protein [Burkholderiales bacterium]
MPSHYETLQVIPHASDAVIKASYRALAHLNHPDHNPNHAEAEALMKAINRAYQILSNPSSRRQYDIEQGYANPVDTTDISDEPEARPEIPTASFAQQQTFQHDDQAQQHEQPQHFFQRHNASARLPGWALRTIIFAAAAIFSLMALAKWIVVSDPNMATGESNEIQDLKLRLDKNPLTIPEI